MFSIDGKLWAFLSKMADLILVNVFFLIFSIPVVTMGASKAALYDVSRRIRRDEESSIFKNFCCSFRGNFKKATIVWGLYVISMVIVGINVYACTVIEMGWMTTVFMMIAMMILLVINITFIYTIMLLIHYNDSIKISLLKGCGLAIANLPLTMVMILMESMLLILLFFYTHYWMYILTFFVIIGFSLTEFVNSYLFDKIVKRVSNYGEVKAENNQEEMSGLGENDLHRRQ